MKSVFSVFILAFFLFGINSATAQTKKQLEIKRKKLQKEIKYISHLLSKTKQTEENLLSKLGDINKKVEIRQSIINTINKEVNAYNKDINENNLEINTLERELEITQKDYARKVRQTYKNNKKQNTLMYILSSGSFTQAYKRTQYLKQYTDFRKEQAIEIKENKARLQVLNDSLIIKRKEKEDLITQEKQEKKLVDVEKSKQQSLISQLKKQEKKYTAQIKKKEKQEEEFEAKLQHLISGLVKPTKEPTTTTKNNSKPKTFKLTPEAKKLESSFVANKGKLPSPVVSGYVSRYFGSRAHESEKKIKVKSNGWFFTTEKNTKARAVFNGKVAGIMEQKQTKLKTVIIQHGNYFTTYKNLTKLLVKTGDKVITKQNLGTIHTDKTTNKTILSFGLFKYATPQNPASWLKR